MAKAEQWRCQICGSRNGFDLHRCRICTRPRPGVLASGRAEIDTPEIDGLPPLPEHHYSSAAFEPMPTEHRSELADTTDSEPDSAAPASPATLIPPVEVGSPGEPVPSPGAGGREAAPAPAAPAPAPATGVHGAEADVEDPLPPLPPMSRRTLVGAAIAIVVVVLAGMLLLGQAKGPGGSGTTDGSLATKPTTRVGVDLTEENREAAAMLPTVADLGATWTQAQVPDGADGLGLGSDPTPADCATPSPALPEAGAGVSFVNPAGGGVAAQVKVFATADAASSDVNTPRTSQAVSDCVRKAVTKELARQGITGITAVDVALRDLEPPGIGDESAAQRLTMTISSPGRTTSMSVVILRFRSGRTMGVLTCEGGPSIATDALVSKVSSVFTNRFGPL
jgi:hypothetical protein